MFVGGAGAQFVEQHVHHGRGQQRKQLAGYQPANDGYAQGLAQLGALAKANGQGQGTERCRHGGHEDGPKTQQTRLAHGLQRRDAARALGLERKVDDHDGVLLDDANQQKHADERNDGELHVEKHERQHRAHARRRQGGEHGDRVDQAFVKNAQHHIDHHDGGDDEEGLLALRLLRTERRAGKAAAHVGRHGDVGLGLLDDLPRLGQRGAGVDIERDGGGQFAVFVADGGGRRLLHHLGDSAQRHHGGLPGAEDLPRGRPALAGVGGHARRARGVGGDVDIFERGRALGVFRGPFHDDGVLVEIVIDGGYRALPKGVVQRGIDGGRAHAQSRCTSAVDLHKGFHTVFGLVGVHILKQGLVLEIFRQPRGPLLEVCQVVALERVLVGGIAGAAAHAQILDGIEEHAQARDLVELRPQTGDDGRRALGALRCRLEVDKHEAAPGPTAAGETDHRIDRRVFADDLHRLAKFACQRLRRDALVSTQPRGQLAVVLLGKVALGDLGEQVYVQAHHRQQDHDDHGFAGQRPVQAARIPAQHPFVATLGPPGQARRRFVGGRIVCAQQPGTHHGCGGKRDHQRDHDRRRQRDRKLAKQAPHLPVHEQERYENRHQ